MATKEQTPVSQIKSEEKPVGTDVVTEKTQETQEVDKLFMIRDLLYGEEVARIDAKIEHYRRYVEDRLKSIETKIETTGQQIQAFIQTSINELNHNLTDQNLKHMQEEDKLEKKLEDVGTKLTELEAHTQQDISITHEEIKQISEEIYQSLKSEVGQLTTKIDNTSKELSANKADKKTIANLLAGMANNLNQINV